MTCPHPAQLPQEVDEKNGAVLLSEEQIAVQAAERLLLVVPRVKLDLQRRRTPHH